MADGRSASAMTAAVAAARVRTTGRGSSARRRSQATSAGRADGWPVQTSRSRVMAVSRSLNCTFVWSTGPHSVSSCSW